MFEPISTIKHMPFGPNVQTYISILACVCHTYISISSIFTVVLEEIVKQTSKTNCYVAMYVCMFVDFHRYLSCGKGHTYKHTFRCRNSKTTQISLYVSERTVNTDEIRIWCAQPCKKPGISYHHDELYTN